MYFLKLYNDLYYDPKVMTLPYRLRWRMIECFLAASINDRDGLLPPEREMAFHAHETIEDIETDLADLATIGILYKSEDGWVVTNWEKRQGRVPAKERMAQMRARKRKAELDTSRDVDPPGSLMEISTQFCNEFGMIERPTQKWVDACTTLKNMGTTPEDLEKAHQVADDNGYTIVGPQSIINIVANIKRSRKTAAPAPDPSALASEVY